MSEEETETTKLKIGYESTTAKYASQVILNATREEVFLDFSSGIVPDQETGVPSVPVHTRIAMSHMGAKRLYELLGRAFRNTEDNP